VGKPVSPPTREAPVQTVEELVEPGGLDDAPPAQPLTRALFYTLAGTTAALGLWALYNLFV
jgi:hypothetical protein